MLTVIPQARLIIGESLLIILIVEWFNQKTLTEGEL